jgi:hypothetical protein
MNAGERKSFAVWLEKQEVRLQNNQRMGWIIFLFVIAVICMVAAITTMLLFGGWHI